MKRVSNLSMPRWQGVVGAVAPSIPFFRDFDLRGWRAGALLATIMCGFTFCFNLVGLIIALALTNGSDGIIRTIYTGSCNTASSLNTALHLVINIISTLILGGTNYCMQCLVAPTRKDVDLAHAEGRFLDIGIPSTRNLRVVGKTRVCFWILLAISSVPLHLMFNSAIFTDLTTFNYVGMFVTADYTTSSDVWRSESCLPNKFLGTTGSKDLDFKLNKTCHAADDLQTLLRVGQAGSYVQNLSLFDCIREYSTEFLTSRRNLIIFTSNMSTESNSSIIDFVFDTDFGDTRTPETDFVNEYSWLCAGDIDGRGPESPRYGDTCDSVIQKLLVNPDAWTPKSRTRRTFNPEYCLSEKVPEECVVHLHVVVLSIVLACNLTKALVMWRMTFSKALEDPLCTIGDTIDSFIRDPDANADRRCLLSEKHAGSGDAQQYVYRRLDSEFHWRETRRRWHDAVAKRHWLAIIVPSFLCLTTVAGLLYLAWGQVSSDTAADIMALGLGKINTRTLISNWALSFLPPNSALLASILVANTPQLILYFLYFMINSFLTRMAVAVEWSRFGYARALRLGPKSLRTSRPEGKQRSTYFLQLPYRIGLPVIALSALLHWLISQSIFLAVISGYDSAGNIVQRFGSVTCGFSILAMIVVMIVYVILLLFMVALGYMKLETGMPMVGCSSTAISAACGGSMDLSEKDRMFLAEHKLVWGELGIRRKNDFRNGEIIRQCYFVCAEAEGWEQEVGEPTNAVCHV